MSELSLIKFLTEKSHAASFISGKMKIVHIRHNRTHMDNRKDEDEGQSGFYWNRKAPTVILDGNPLKIVGLGESEQLIFASGSTLNPTYILSASRPDIEMEYGRNRFGSAVVKINNKQALLERFKKAWSNHSYSREGKVDLLDVIYNRGEIVEANEALIAPPDYDIIQKAPIYQEERESRYVFRCSFDYREKYPGIIWLDVGNCSDICSLEA